MLCLFGLLAAACSSTAGSASDASSDADDATASTQPVEEASSADDAEAGTVSEAAAVDEPVVEVRVTPLTTDVGVDDGEIRVGYSLDLSGPLSAYDARLLDGHIARFDEVNAAGGIAGRSISVVALDNGGDGGVHQENLARLTADGPDGVVAIGGLSQPSLDADSSLALGSSDLLVIGNGAFADNIASPDTLIPLRPGVCLDTVTGLSSLLDDGDEDDDPAQLALFAGPEDWAGESVERARSIAEELELDIVLDESINPDADDGETIGDLVEALVSSDADVVWVAGSAEVLLVLSRAIDVEASSSWVWGGPSANMASGILETVDGARIAGVYQFVGAGPLVDDPELADVRDGLADFAPELTYADSGASLLGWEQADVLVAALEQAATGENLTRALVASTALALAPELPQVMVYEVEITSDRNAVLSSAGSSGFTEIFSESDVPTDIAALCQ